MSIQPYDLHNNTNPPGLFSLPERSSTAQFRAVVIEELRRNVIDHIISGNTFTGSSKLDASTRETLRNWMLVCRSFFQDSVQFYWKHIDSLSALLYVLEAEVWSPWEIEQGLSREAALERYISLEYRAPMYAATCPRFARFRFYANHVEHISVFASQKEASIEKPWNFSMRAARLHQRNLSSSSRCTEFQTSFKSIYGLFFAQYYYKIQTDTLFKQHLRLVLHHTGSSRSIFFNNSKCMPIAGDTNLKDSRPWPSSVQIVQCNFEPFLPRLIRYAMRTFLPSTRC
ncbi:hypothetical protein C8Q78DRAFT_993634 [Trametes maxima]|nr:hypothetical protein C8Q78DRAFT_993634 [Trametes maxima]